MAAIESQLIDAGITPLAGVDEAGRGACAGPLVIASVILHDPFAEDLAAVRDSKDVSEKERENLFELLVEKAAAISTIIVPPAEVDGYAIDGLGIANLAVWKGDQVAHCISAASIIAKVTRDRIMRELDTQYPDYGFAKHKGYITAAHTTALNQHGPCIEHRRSFANIAALINKNK
jgi:ribonuclease HII